MTHLSKVKADLAINTVASILTLALELGLMGAVIRLIATTPILIDLRKRNVAILESANAEVGNRSVPLFECLKDQTSRVDTIPLPWVHTKVFQSDF